MDDQSWGTFRPDAVRNGGVVDLFNFCRGGVSGCWRRADLFRNLFKLRHNPPNRRRKPSVANCIFNRLYGLECFVISRSPVQSRRVAPASTDRSPHFSQFSVRQRLPVSMRRNLRELNAILQLADVRTAPIRQP